MGNSIQVEASIPASTRFFSMRPRFEHFPEPAVRIQNPLANSYALGQEHPYVVINTGILDLLNVAEIQAVLAHELGHIKCGHTI